MTWPGTATIRRRGGGRYGGSARLGGGYLVPRHVVYEFTGDNGHPDVHAHFEVRDGRPICTDLRVISKPEGRGVRTRDVEAQPVDQLTEAVFLHLAELIVQEHQPGVDLGEADERPARAKIRRAITQPGRDKSPADLRQVAAAFRSGLPDGTVLAVADALGVSERTAARRIAEARDAGLIPAATRKRAR